MSLLLLFHNNHRFIDFDFLPPKESLKKKHQQRELKIIETEIAEEAEQKAKSEVDRIKKQIAADQKKGDAFFKALKRERQQLFETLNQLRLADEALYKLLYEMDLFVAREMARKQEEEDLLLLMALL